MKARALDAGAPHLRRRVFVLAELGGAGRSEVLEASRDNAWDRPWPTPTSGNHNETEDPASFAARSARMKRPLGEPLGQAVRQWPTPTAGDAKASGSRSLEGSDAHSGTSLTDAVRPDRTTADRPWPTPTAGDAKGAGPNQHTETLGKHIRADTGKRLNPEWIETLMGFPQGWTDIDSWQLGLFAPKPHRLEALRDPVWPRGRYPKDWDRSKPWPGYDWEPSRTLPDGPPVRGRADRLRALGNAVCPQQGAVALGSALRANEK